MSARRLMLAAAALVALVATAAVVIASRAWERADGPGLGAEPIVGSTFLEPEQHLFGDAIRARLELVVDRNRVDPETVDVGANFAPYTLLRPVEVTRSDSGSLTRLRHEYLLACLTARCLPDASGRVELGGTAVNYTRRGGGAPDAATIEWPPIRVAGRIAPAELEQAALRAELRDLPTPSYRVSPAAVEAVALGLAVLFAVAAAILILRLLPLEQLARRLGARRVDRRTPLEHALALVRESSAAGTTEEGRRALERLAVELRRTSNPALASAASRLAWSDRRRADTGVASLSEEVQRVIGGNGRNGR